MTKITPRFLKTLQALIPKSRISFSLETRTTHGKDRSFHRTTLPEIVVWPTSTKEVSAIVALANKHTLPVTVRGGGSSLEGNPIPVKGGIVLNMTKLNSLLSVDSASMQVRVQPGIVSDELNRQLQTYNHFFPAAPGSSYIATIGGVIANNAGGMYAVKYGVVGDWVLKLEVVLANGDVIQVGSGSFKSVSGYDLKRLFIGSEGTLGIITEATLKLAQIPALKLAALVSFQTVEQAVRCATRIIQSDIEPAALEFMDTTYMSLVNKAKDARLEEAPSLIVELHGNETILFEKMKTLQILCKKHALSNCRTFTTKKEQTLLWDYRRAVRPMLSKLLPNTGVLSAEVGLPLGAMQAFLAKAEMLSKQYGLQTIMFGHMGDGNFHGWALYELGNKKSWKKVTKLNEDLITFALKVGGTTTGEHGIGIGKRKFLSLEHPTGLPLMKGIKHLLDPKGILNPGKIFPD